MAKPRTPSKGGPTSDEQDPNTPRPADATPNEPVSLSTLKGGGVLHNPPQATQDQQPGTIDEE